MLIYYLDSVQNAARFQIVDAKEYLVTAAKNGGPIAVMRYLQQPIVDLSNPDNTLIKNLCFFANDGTRINTVPIEENKLRVVCFSFIQDEFLLVFLENGKYYLIDPNPQHINVLETSDVLTGQLQQLKIIDAKVCDNGIVFATVPKEVVAAPPSTNPLEKREPLEVQFYYVPNVKSPDPRAIRKRFCTLRVDATLSQFMTRPWVPIAKDRWCIVPGNRSGSP